MKSYVVGIKQGGGATIGSFCRAVKTRYMQLNGAGVKYRTTEISDKPPIKTYIVAFDSDMQMLIDSAVTYTLDMYLRLGTVSVSNGMKITIECNTRISDTKLLNDIIKGIASKYKAGLIIDNNKAYIMIKEAKFNGIDAIDFISRTLKPYNTMVRFFVDGF